MIAIKQLTHRFDGAENLLNGINVTVRRGENLVIVGPSGQGKSTLLKILSGLTAPHRGEVLINGKNLYKVSRLEKTELMSKTGMLFQKNALFDSLTVGENLAFPLREVAKLDEKKIAEKVKEYLSAVELGPAENLYPDEISGGMQKRLGIARALILDPEIIYYDDPTAGLDPITSRNIVELIKKLNKKLNATTVTITNEMNRAYQLADNIGVLMDSELVITGSVEETKTFTDKKIQNFIQGIPNNVA
ncbi:MAG: ATP-binding cassette domain-containing protein [Oligoflexia bacterium]|nr:ATP-binding cassette domain-containing protein [Oligoflexia bacterium]